MYSCKAVGYELPVDESHADNCCRRRSRGCDPSCGVGGSYACHGGNNRQSLASASVATVLSNSLRISCSVVSDEEQGESIENGLEVKATLLNEPPTVAAVLMNETPTVGVTLLNNVGVTAMRATEPLNVSLSEVCMVGDEEMTVLSASDQLLYYADGGYVRLNPE